MFILTSVTKYVYVPSDQQKNFRKRFAASWTATELNTVALYQVIMRDAIEFYQVANGGMYHGGLFSSDNMLYLRYNHFFLYNHVSLDYNR